MLTRRIMLGAVATAPVAVLPAVAASDPLAALIARYRRLDALSDELDRRISAIEDNGPKPARVVIGHLVYKKEDTDEEVVLPQCTGIIHQIEQTAEWARDHRFFVGDLSQSRLASLRQDLERQIERYDRWAEQSGLTSLEVTLEEVLDRRDTARDAILQFQPQNMNDVHARNHILRDIMTGGFEFSDSEVLQILYASNDEIDRFGDAWA